MALKMDWKMRSGATISDAYIIVEIKKQKSSYDGMCIIISPYHSFDDKEKGRLEPPYEIILPLLNENYSGYFTEVIIANAGKTDLKQAYNYVKSLSGTETDSFLSKIKGIDFTLSTNI